MCVCGGGVANLRFLHDNSTLKFVVLTSIIICTSMHTHQRYNEACGQFQGMSLDHHIVDLHGSLARSTLVGREVTKVYLEGQTITHVVKGLMFIIL